MTNTPWRERHAYVLPVVDGALDGNSTSDLHVSPFMPMEQRYAWRLSAPQESLQVHMQNLQNGQPVFDASMSLKRDAHPRRHAGARAARHFPS